MASARERRLPARRNTELTGIENDEELKQEMIDRRKLASTELVVESGQVGTSNATKPGNLGRFEYATLRVPLPKDLSGSGLFHSMRGRATPDGYFMMRRVNDGYVSATGLFKIAFPWATVEEMKTERVFVKTLNGVDHEEIAGNTWVAVETAFRLAEDYGLKEWLTLLCHPSPMVSRDENLKITQPPVYRPDERKAEKPKRTTRQVSIDIGSGTLPPPSETPARKRTLRSASPTKMAPPDPSVESSSDKEPSKKTRKIANPKTRRTPAKSASVEPTDDSSSVTSSKRISSRKTSNNKHSFETPQVIPEEEDPISEEEDVANAHPTTEISPESSPVNTKQKQSKSQPKLQPTNKESSSTKDKKATSPVKDRKVSSSTTKPTTNNKNSDNDVNKNKSSALSSPENNNVKPETPARQKHAKLPSDAQAYLDSAKKALDDARGLLGARNKRKAEEMANGSPFSKDRKQGMKRKVRDFDDDEDDEEEDDGRNENVEKVKGRPVKRIRLEQVIVEERKERIRQRATVGILGGLVVGAIVPALVGTFFSSF